MVDDTRTQILNAAQEMVQTRGYNAFSYRDLSEVVGVKTSSIHYYFPTKGDLGIELLQRYSSQMEEKLAEFDRANLSPEGKLKKFCGLLESALRQNERLCLCGSFASQSKTLPPELVDKLRLTIEAVEKWLTGVLEQGREDQSLGFRGNPRKVATAFFSALQGNMICARVCGDADCFCSNSKVLIDLLK